MRAGAHAHGEQRRYACTCRPAGVQAESAPTCQRDKGTTAGGMTNEPTNSSFRRGRSRDHGTSRSVGRLSVDHEYQSTSTLTRQHRPKRVTREEAQIIRVSHQQVRSLHLTGTQTTARL